MDRSSFSGLLGILTGVICISIGFAFYMHRIQVVEGFPPMVDYFIYWALPTIVSAVILVWPMLWLDNRIAQRERAKK